MNTFDCLNFLLKPGVHIIAGLATIAKKKLRDQNDCIETVRSAIVAIATIAISTIAETKTCIFYLSDRSDRDHCDTTIAERTVSIQSF